MFDAPTTSPDVDTLGIPWGSASIEAGPAVAGADASAAQAVMGLGVCLTSEDMDSPPFGPYDSYDELAEADPEAAEYDNFHDHMSPTFWVLWGDLHDEHGPGLKLSDLSPQAQKIVRAIALVHHEAGRVQAYGDNPNWGLADAAVALAQLGITDKGGGTPLGETLTKEILDELNWLAQRNPAIRQWVAKLADDFNPLTGSTAKRLAADAEAAAVATQWALDAAHVAERTADQSQVSPTGPPDEPPPPSLDLRSLVAAPSAPPACFTSTQKCEVLGYVVTP